MIPSLVVGAFLATAALLFLEWRRPDRQHLTMRLVAVLLAVLMLGLLAVQPGNPASARSPAEGVLWTAGSTPSDADHAASLQFALPDAAATAPRNATVIPDVAFLRRRFPGISTLHVFGDGLDPADLPALTGLRLDFHPSTHPVASVPAILFLHCPRELPFGSPLVVQGRLAGLPAGTTLPLSLEAPDGNRTDAVTGAADARGEADFALRAPPLSATGRFVWRLRFGQSTASLGVSVVPPLMPRVLVLEGAPQFDTAARRRWFERVGGDLTTRTRVGKDHFRFASTRKDALPFDAVNADLLSGYDLLLADSSALANLPPAELAALDAAISQTGLGLLVLADASLLPPGNPPTSSTLQGLLPWKFALIDQSPSNEERTVRLHWLGQGAPSEIPVDAAPFSILRAAGQFSLIDDRRDHSLAAATNHGWGQVAVTLVRDTARWQRENDLAAFADYWSFLFSRLSRPDDAAGHWSLTGGDGGPVFVDHPLGLCWSGSSNGPGAATVTDESGGAGVTLPLAQDPREPGWWQSTFWPRRAGWHRGERFVCNARFLRPRRR